MFINAQYINKMKTQYNITSWFFSLALVGLMASCATVNTIPDDDIYYSKKNSNSMQDKGNLAQSSVPVYSNSTAASKSDGDFNYSSQYEGYVGEDQATNGFNDSGEQTDNNYEFIDEYYDSDYESRINRFGSTGTSSNFGYYDNYYTGNNCNCGYGSNVSLSFGFGYGYGYGYPHYGFGYGYPYYGYGYGYGYPYFGYPYYGYPYYGGSYWNGYWNGYYDGMYGYYPGYYPDYNYGGIVYQPRRGSAGGTTIPRSGTRSSGDDLTGGDKTVIAGNRSAGTVAGGGGTVATATPSTGDNTSSTIVTSNKGTSRLPVEDITSGTTTNKGTVQVQDRSAVETQDRMSKPDVSTNNGTVANSRYQKPVTSKSNTQQSAPRYEKPKSYQSLPSQKPRSSQEYIKPVNNNNSTSVNRSNPYSKPGAQQNKSGVSGNNVNRSNPVNTNSGRSVNTSKSNNFSGNSTPARSYTSPTRSSGSGSSTGSFSSPSRSSGSSSGGGRSGGGGGVSSSRSSSSSSSGGGGGRNR